MHVCANLPQTRWVTKEGIKTKDWSLNFYASFLKRRDVSKAPTAWRIASWVEVVGIFASLCMKIGLGLFV